MELGRLHVIIDVTPGRDWLGLSRAVLDAGAPVLQLRAKTATDRDVFDMAVALRPACERAGALLLVDDRVDVAMAAGAGGVHVGEHDLPVAAARSLLGGRPVLGATARDAATARRHQADGASYLGVGPCYATTSKEGLPDPIGIGTLRDVCAAVPLPVIAIAGVTVERVPELLAAGAHGVAVIGAIANASDPGGATAGFLDALAQAVPA